MPNKYLDPIPITTKNTGGYWTTEIEPTKEFASDKKVGDRNVRNGLLTNAQNSGYGDGNHVYVEVIQKGKEEGEFLEDENAVSNWKLKDVSKLVYWSHRDIFAEIKRLNWDAHGQEPEGKIAEASNVAGGVFSWFAGKVGVHTHHSSLQNARTARDRRNN